MEFLRRSNSTGKQEGEARRRTTIGLSLALVAFLLRVPSLDGVPEDWDGVDFVLAMDEFDLSRYQPHFPGYPVYVVLGKLLHALGIASGTAIDSVGLIAGSALPWILFAGLRSRVREPEALASAALVAVHPTLVLEASAIHSDTLALAMLVGSFAFAARGRGVLAGVLLGACLGSRPSYFALLPGPLLISANRNRHQAIRAFASAALSGLVSILLLRALAGPGLWSEGAQFVRGHFFEWGGTPFSSGGAPSRWVWLATGARSLAGEFTASRVLLAFALAAASSVVVATTAALYRSVRRHGARPAWQLLLSIGPYCIWMLLAQNPRNPRHLLPVLLLILVSAGPGMMRTRWTRVLLVVAFSAWGIIDVSCALRSRGGLPAAERFARFLSSADVNAIDIVYCGASRRFLDLHAVDRRVSVVRARTFQGVVADVRSQIILPERVAVTSEVDGVPSESPVAWVFESKTCRDDRELMVYLFLVKKASNGEQAFLEPMIEPDPTNGRRSDDQEGRTTQ